jgi:hypothetical protein
MSKKSPSQWFIIVAQAVRDEVDRNSGAIVYDKDTLRELLTDRDAELLRCPESVWEHLTCPLRPRQGLIAQAYHGLHGDILLVFDPDVFKTDEAARKHCNDMGLPPDVVIMLRELEAVPA